MHRILADHDTRTPFRSASFHGAPGVASALRGIPGAVAAAARRAPSRTLAKRCGLLAEAYAEAAHRADETGPTGWPCVVIHGDWHPGNLVYRDERIAGVLDFDSTRVEPRVMDVANAALQFSMRTAGAGPPDTWPEGLDLPRIQALLLGYNRAAATPLAAGERRALPWLIIEAIIVESVVPIAATGRFGDIDGAAFLEMVERKVRWLAPRAAGLAESIDAPPS
jgi:homoserine kinase type II